jgi:hypothetical protein
MQSVELTEKAKHRLKILDYYFKKSPAFSSNGKPNAALTCRHFGIHRSYFYFWLKRYQRKRLSSLENRPTAPLNRRRPEYPQSLVIAVKEIRKADPTYSGKKIRPILLRTMAEKDVPSVATLGRLIRRENLFFRADTKRRKKRANSAKKAHERLRKPYGLKPEDGSGVVEFDMKHVYLLGMKQYAFCAVNVLHREAVVHVASSPSSLNARAAVIKSVERWGRNICFVNDNGSGELKFETWPRSRITCVNWK